MSVTLAEIIGACGTVGAGILWVIHAIVRPLRDSLDRVNLTLEKLDKTISEERERRHDLELSITKLQATSEDHEHRLEELERR